MTTSHSSIDSLSTLSAIEQVLTDSWKKILSVDQLNIHDNFFERGGNGFLALGAISTINKSFDRHLSLSTIFDYPTIESLAKALASKKHLAARSLVHLKTGGKKYRFI